MGYSGKNRHNFIAWKSTVRYLSNLISNGSLFLFHDDVIKWNQLLRYWPFVWGIHRWSVNSPHKVQWRGALVFSLICALTNGWVNNWDRDTGDLRRHRAYYDVTVTFVCVYTCSSSYRLSAVLLITSVCVASYRCPSSCAPVWMLAYCPFSWLMETRLSVQIPLYRARPANQTEI